MAASTVCTAANTKQNAESEIFPVMTLPFSSFRWFVRRLSSHYQCRFKRSSRENFLDQV
jgi:hypothetical protein